MAVTNWVQYTELMVGRSAPVLVDTLNRPLRSVLTVSGYDPDLDFLGFAKIVHTHIASSITDLATANTGITSVGIVGTGTWQGTPIAAAYIGAHNQAFSTITGLPSTIAGYGITVLPWANVTGAPATLAGYGISNAYTSAQTDTLLAAKAAVATTLAGYGITDAYTKAAGDARYAPIAVPFGTLTGLPTTLSGYGITDGATLTSLTTLNASNLTTGTIPGARFPASLPALDASALTALSASALTTGTVPNARLAGSYTGVTGLGVVTAGSWQATAIAPTFGGTGLAAYAVGDILYGSATNVLAALAGNGTATKKYLSMTSGVPSWAQPSAAEILAGTFPAGAFAFAGAVSGITTLTATTGAFTNLGGTITTAAQPNVTSLGTLSVLTVTGAGATAATVNGSGVSGASNGLRINAGTTGSDDALAVNLPEGIVMRVRGDSKTIFQRTLTGTLFSTHAIEDQTTLNASGNGSSFCSYDMIAQIVSGNTFAYDHIANFQARAGHLGTGVLSYWYGFMAFPGGSAGTALNGPTTNVYEFQGRDPVGTATITNLVGLRIEQLTRGTNNYAIQTAGNTPSEFGGVVNFLATINTTTVYTTGSITSASTTGDILHVLDRHANTNNAALQLKTNGVVDWLIGTRSTADSDFHLYSFGLGSDALSVSRATGALTVNANVHVTAGGITVDAGTSAMRDVTTTGNVTSVSATGDILHILDRLANTNNAALQLKTNGTVDWLIGGRGTGDSDLHLFAFGLSADALTVSRATGNATFAASISTGAPSGGAAAWKLGIANAVSPTSPNRTVTVEIAGTVYYLAAKTTNN
jgi:hypothetical protein